MISSPRTRRRLMWVVGVAVVAAGVAAVIAVLPETSGRSSQELLPEPAQIAPEPASTSTRIRRADRREIAATLSSFVDAAVNRRHPGAAYDLVTPALRRGQTRADWASGDIPVYPYKSRAAPKTGWWVRLTARNEVQFDVLLQPAATSDLGAISFTADFKRIHGRWLVDSFLPAASFAPVKKQPRVSATADFTPQRGSSSSTTSTQPSGGRLGVAWLAVPLGLLSLIVIVPLVFFLRSWWRDRSAYRRPLDEPKQTLFTRS